jgi:outer membrane receptor protein involved in Fe transport
MMGGVVTGRIVESEFQVPLEYANVVLYDARTKEQVTGAMAVKDGFFTIRGVRPGVFFMEVKFIGYYLKTIENIRVGARQPEVDVGVIELEQAMIPVEEIIVEAEKPPVEFKIDRKVINVGKQYTALAGTAVDVLENVPSVTVDIEGNVSLRGSTNFTVLIDGRPTILEPNEALQQMRTTEIETIEIITNPSAKYDPDGLAGIINIVTKKGELSGTSGVVNVTGGLGDKYGADFLLYYRTKGYNLYFGADWSSHAYPGTTETENRTYTETDTSIVYSSGEPLRKRERYGIKGGVELTLGRNDFMDIQLRAGARSGESDANYDYEEWISPPGTYSRYVSRSDHSRSGDFYSAKFDYRHTFARKGHQLVALIDVSRRDGEEESSDELLDLAGQITSGRRSSESGPGDRLTTKIDYTLPLREEDKFEAGYQSRFGRSEEINELYDYDPVGGDYVFQPDYSNTTNYDEDIHSLYSLYQCDLGRFGFQGGVRGEYTYRFIELVDTDETFSIDEWDVFPTFHTSYEDSSGNHLMASYTRRIERPRSWYLEPFVTWMDAYNVRRGNPDLEPEYIDSYELGYQRSIGSSMFALEGYYRVTHNKIERVRSVYEENVILHTIENVGTDYMLGTELTLTIDAIRWWNINLMGNIYDYRVEGVLYDEPFERTSFNWSSRLNNTIKIGKSTRIQINGMYNSETASSQGTAAADYMVNAAIKQDFLQRRLSATLQVRDLFATGKHEHVFEGPDFYSKSHFTHDAPVVMITLTYNFNNYKPDRERNGEREEFEDVEF